MRLVQPARYLIVLTLLLAGVAAFGTPASAGHGAENGNYTVSLPFATDHYPGTMNPENASIDHFAAATKESFERAGAPDGVAAISYITLYSAEIDFSACSTKNTAAFGIDRDSDDPGTHTDVSLLKYMEGNVFHENGIIVDFYEGDELAAPPDAPVGIHYTDEIVAHQGYRSAGGPCYTMPAEPGWYQIQGYLNGTAVGSGDYVEIFIPSHYFYICECGSEAEARERLGPPPGERTAADEPIAATPTPAPTATPEERSTPEPTATPAPARSTVTATATPAPDVTDAPPAPEQAVQRTEAPPARQPVRAEQPRDHRVVVTPTVADGPGFGPVASLVALLGAALLAARRGVGR